MNEGFKQPEEGQDIEGRYADTCRIGYSAYKFTLDFGQLTSENRATNYHTRIIISPNTVKALHKRIGESIREYEAHYDEIKADDQ